MARNNVKRDRFRVATRTVCGLALLWVVFGLISSTGAFAAHAYLWSDPVKTANRGVFGVGGREALYTASSQGGAPYSERVFNPNGAVEWEVKTDPTTIVPPALASDGSGYVVWVSGGSDVIEAINTAGTVRWNYTVPNGRAVAALVAGDDGAAYAAIGTAAGEEVLRLSPEDGSVTFATLLPEADGGVLKLLAAPNGVAAITSTHVLFVSQEGQIAATSEPLSPVWATSNNAGDVFVGSRRSGETGTANGIAVTKVEPTGHVAWTADTPANGGAAAPTSLAALPDGGVAYDVSSQSLGVLNVDGTNRWNAEKHEGYDGGMLSDGSGHLVVASYVFKATCSDKIANCGGFRVEQLGASNGQLAHTVAVVSTKDGYYNRDCGGLALSSEMVYVFDDLAKVGPGSCEPAGKPQLQAYALPETAGPYPTPPATTEPAAKPPTATYVALGDSYSSGEGNPPFEAGTEVPGLDECHRSGVAYSQLLDSSVGLGPMSFKACSGAVTDDLFTTNLSNPAEGAQLAWLGAQTKTVTLTIGGNDAGFAAILETCVAGARASWPFNQRFGCATDATLTTEADTRLKALEGVGAAFTPPPESRPIHSLLEVIKTVHADAPSARIVVGGYPPLFGVSKKAYKPWEPIGPYGLAPSGRACEVGEVLATGLLVEYLDAQWLDALARRLDGLIQGAVSVAVHEGIAVSYADPTKPFAHHSLCDTDLPWLYPVVITTGESLLPKLEPGTFHPTAEGQVFGYAAAFKKALK